MKRERAPRFWPWALGSAASLLILFLAAYLCSQKLGNSKPAAFTTRDEAEARAQSTVRRGATAENRESTPGTEKGHDKALPLDPSGPPPRLGQLAGISGDINNLGRWKVSKSVSKMDDSVTTVLTLDADNVITGWPGETHRPTLFIRQMEGELDVYINTGLNPAVELEYSGGIWLTESAKATYRFDKKSAVTAWFNKSTDGKALFWRDPRSAVDRMLGHNKLVFRFTPFNSNPATATFTLTGLQNAIVEIEEFNLATR